MDSSNKQNNQTDSLSAQVYTGMNIKPLLAPTLKKTRFSQMTFEQLEEKARVNNLRRCILRVLILESDFAQPNSKFARLVAQYNNCAPCFDKTVPQRQMRSFHIKCGAQKVRVIVNLCDSFTQKIWERVQSSLVLDAQIFGIELNINHMVDVKEGPLLSLIQSLSTIAAGVCQVSSIVGLAGFVYRIIRMLFAKTFDYFEALLLILEGLTRFIDFDAAHAVANQLKDHFLAVYQWVNGKLFAQADIDPIASLATILAICFGTTVLKSVPKGSQLDEIVSGATKCGNLLKGLSGSWQVIEKVATFVFEKIYEWKYGVNPNVVKLESFLGGVTQWYKDVQDLISLNTPEEISINSELCVKVEQLYAAGVRYSAMIGEFKFDKNVVTGFQTHFRVLQACYDRAQSSGAFRGGPRVEPIVIHLHGTSGVGKSGMMYPLAIDVLKVDGIPNADYTEHIYMRNIEQEFWDGYKNQRICIYDDFGQMKDSQAKPNLEFMELIRTGNLAPFPLHCASIEDKSKTFFKSRAVIMTSNVAVFRPESLSWPDAVRRRVDLSVEIRVKRRFATFDNEARTWRLDPVKVFNELGVHHSMEVYDAYECDPQTGHHRNNVAMSYDELSERVRTLYRVRFEHSTAFHKFLSERAQAQILIPETEDQERNGRVHLRDPIVAFQELDCDELEFMLRDANEFGSVCPLFDLDTKMWMCVNHVALQQPDVDVSTVIAHVSQMMKEAKYAKDASQIAQGMILTYQREQRVSDLLNRGIPLSPFAQHPFFYHFIEKVDVNKTLWVLEQNQKFVMSVANVAVQFKDACLKKLAQAKECLAEAKWYHFALLSLPIVSILWYLYSKKESKRNVLQRFSSQRRDPKVMSVEDATAFVELSASADPKTGLKPKVRVESTLQTGMPCLKCGKKSIYHTSNSGVRSNVCGSCGNECLIELSASADPKTGLKPKVRVESEIVEEEQVSFLDKALPLVPIATAVAVSAFRKFSPKLQAHLQLDPNAFNVSKKVLNNLYEMQLEIDGVWGPKIKVCMLRGRVGLTVAHLLPHLEKAKRIRLYNKNVPDGHIFSVDTLKTEIVLDSNGEVKDQLLIAFPKSLHDHADIVGNIADSFTMSKFSRVNAVLCTPCDIGAMMRFGPIRSFDVDSREYVDGPLTYVVRDRYEYTAMETTAGDCGSILIGIGTFLPRKILGMHIAGSTGLGVSTPLNVRDIERALHRLPFEAQIQLDLDLYLTETNIFDEVKLPEGNFVPVGTSHLAVSSPSKTQLRHSLCYEKISQSTHAPSVLRPVKRNGVLIDPMYLGLKKAGRIPPEINQTYLDAAINDVKNMICCNILDSDCRVLTNMEAVIGVEGDDCMVPINRKSSAGYPWMKEQIGGGKKRWLGDDEDYFLSPDVEFVMRERERMALLGQRYPTFWIDTLKDERRPLEKVEAVKTRVFSAGSMDYTLSFRKYFLGFAAHCARNRIDNEISVGTNVYSYDWARTAKKCTSKGLKVIAGDFSNFDGTLVLPILYQILEIVDAFYDDGEDNKKIRHVLWKEIINSVHVCGDQVYLWTHSQPSGCPITAILNSIFNSVSMRYCWMEVFRDQPTLQSMKSFNEHVAMVSYGDDNVINISDAVCEKFNQLTIAEAYATLGMVYTDESKSGEMVKYRDINTVAYLKRTFRYDASEMTWVAPLAMETILEMTNWIRGDADQEASTIENLQTSAFELSQHGRDVFEHWIPKYRAAAKEFASPARFLTYDEYRLAETIKQGRLNGVC